jgi:malate dehydrogenase (oxaloacetate-decarboxylating)(NADP+)
VCPERRSVPELRGYDLLQHPRYNRGMAFTEEERDALGLRGLLPPRIISLTDQVERSMRHLERKITPLERYIYMTGLLDRGEVLFYRTVIDHIVELMPIIYTPTVGEACQRWGEIFRRQRGLYVTSDDRGRVRDVLRNWPDTDVEVVVATDGERILGLGDLGAQGMGIPIGKLALYTACAGIAPARCLPITIDVGTENLELRQSPFYPGLDQPRLRGAEYDALMEEFVDAVREVFPRAMLQWEDFATDNAFRVLAAHRHRIRSFNDDIQGTASVALAGLYAASRATDRPLHTQRVLFFGAGSAATGIGELVVSAMVADGIPEAEARRRCWFVDSKGLVTSNRTDLAPHKLPFAHDHPPVNDLHSAMRSIKPTALIGVAAQPKAFSEPILRTFADQELRPIVFALSNPTSKAECTAEEAYRWTDGRALFASGSPMAPVELDGNMFSPRQANNVYIFPGVGLGVVATQARMVSDAMFLVAARTLAETVTAADLAEGALFPPLTEIRRVSVRIATAVARVAHAEGLATVSLPEDLEGSLAARMYDPIYREDEFSHE